MGEEPIMPEFEDKLKDPEEVDNATNKGVEDDKTKGKADEMSDEPAKEFDEIIEGWREDRKELIEAKKRLRELEDKKGSAEDEDEELEGLTEREKLEKIVEKREAKIKAMEDAQLEEIRQEIRFHERTDKFFRDNKADILKMAEKIDAVNLDQAIRAYKIGKGVVEEKSNALNDKLKKNAGGVKGGGSGGRSVNIAPYDPKTESNMSFGDFYKKAGVR